MNRNFIMGAVCIYLLAALGAVHAVERGISYTYNESGQVLSVDGPGTDVEDITRYQYDAQGNRTRTTNALGHVTQISAHDASGRPLTVIDPNGLTTQLEYDLRGRLVRIDKGGELTEMGYDAVGNLTALTGPDANTLRLHYDAARRLVAVEDANGNRIDYTLDAMGNRTRVEVHDAGGELLQRQQASFDGLSRTLADIGALEQRTEYSYDANGNVLSVTDAKGQSVQYSYDALNRLVSATDPLGGVVGYHYDVQDRLSTVTDPNGNSTHYVYDGLGNLIEQHSPDTGLSRFEHDAAGNIIKKTDAKLQETTYRYDALNRLVEMHTADGEVIRYHYDSGEHGIGRLTSISEAGGSTSWSYDRHGRITQKRQSILVDGTPTQLVTAYRYNAAGQLAGLTYPSGLQVDYTYSQGQITAVAINNNAFISQIAYRPFGPVTGWLWANGRQHSRLYNLDGLMNQQDLGQGLRTLEYDVLGNLVSVEEGGERSHYSYDALGRLSTADDPDYALSWSYDANGNRLSETDAGLLTNYELAGDSNRLLGVLETPYSYDANGNLIQDGEHRYRYNALNRLVSVDEEATGRYRYNALGQRVYKKGLALAGDLDGDGIISQADLKLANGSNAQDIDCEGPGQGKGKGQQVACVAGQIGDYARQGSGNKQEPTVRGNRERWFAYDESGRLIGEYNRDGSPAQETVYLGNLPVATARQGVVYAVHSDHLGTPRAITDSSNKELWRWDSDPFGEAEPNEDPDGDGIRFVYNLRFPGQYYDAETGRHYNYFRDYDPGTGRYIESDPIGLDGALNTYAYVDSNPLLFLDFFGLEKVEMVMYQIAIGTPSIMFDVSISLTHNQTYTMYVMVDDSCIREREWLKRGWFGGAGADMSVKIDDKSALFSDVTPGMKRSFYMAEKYSFKNADGCGNCEVTISREVDNAHGLMNGIFDVLDAVR